MSYHQVLAILPEAHTVSTVSHELHPEEHEARSQTLATVLTITADEAESLLNAGRTDAFLCTIAHAWQYLTTLYDRRPKPATGTWNNRIPDDTTDAIRRLNKLTQANMHLIPDDEDENEHTGYASITVNSEDEDDHEAAIIAQNQATAIFIIAMAAALTDHINQMTAQGPLVTGHALATIGFHLTLQELADNLNTLHDRSRHDTELADRAEQKNRDADIMLTAAHGFIAPAITKNISASIEADPEAAAAAHDLATETIEDLETYNLHLAGSPFDPHRSMHAYFSKGVLHVTRLSEPFPKNVDRMEALAMAIANADAHLAEDRASQENQALLIHKRSEEVLRDADQMLHRVTDTEVDRFLNTLAATTSEPVTQARAALAFLGDAPVAQRHMLRRRDLFPPATKDQADAVAAALEKTRVAPRLAELITNILLQGPAALSAAPDEPDHDALIHLLGTAHGLRQSEDGIMELAYAMGAVVHNEPDIEAFIDSLDELSSSPPLKGPRRRTRPQPRTAPSWAATAAPAPAGPWPRTSAGPLPPTGPYA